MAEIRQYKCDGCGTLKGETNHWYKVRIKEAFHIYRWNFGGEGSEDLSAQMLHLCGSACVTKAVSEFMGAK